MDGSYTPPKKPFHEWTDTEIVVEEVALIGDNLLKPTPMPRRPDAISGRDCVQIMKDARINGPDARSSDFVTYRMAVWAAEAANRSIFERLHADWILATKLKNAGAMNLFSACLKKWFDWYDGALYHDQARVKSAKVCETDALTPLERRV